MLVRVALLVVLLSLDRRGLAQTRPVTGATVPEYASLDQAVLSFMDRIDCPAATAVVSRNGKLIYSRGFGWSDAHGKKPTPPDALLRIGGLTQPITAAAVKKLIRDGKMALDTKAFKLLNLKPPRGTKPDPRLDRITIRQLLEHQAGWDSDSAYDPFLRLHEIEKHLRLSRRPRPADVVRYMLAEPLQFDPGQRTAHSNFGYCLLGRVIEKVAGKPYATYIAEDVFRPLGVDDVKLARNLPRDPREVWYPVKNVPVEVMDSFAGLVASAPALCKFLDAYWINGEPRRPGEELHWTYFGNIVGTTAMVRQRPDGYNIAILCNSRRKEAIQEEDDRALEQQVDEAIDKVAAASVK
ncbi:MAG TPA: serine hydrolase domain-containing protein [Planctomycetaceae bacterium]|nr:serine hydrolase domain-containing protein [Planctomycetaceae bacterium]